MALPALASAQEADAYVAASSDPDHPIFQTGRRVMVAERLHDGERVDLDGCLDEEIWTRAEPAKDFVMQDPLLGGAPTEPTEVRIALDRDNLYLGVTAYDSEPDRLLGNTMKRDEFLSADDRFMWTIDTFLDQQTGYFFEMNPSGLMADAVMGPGGGNNREWDGIWDARVSRSEIGWTIEIVIPFRTLNFDPDAPAWGINFQRTVRRKSEESLWTGFERNQGLRRMSNAGLLVGIRDVSQGMGIDVRPYVAAKVAEAPGRAPAADAEGTGDIGVDLYYNLTPNLRANLTINTDFAETEVDQRQVNLTRFPLLFPEKRGFFLEGGTFFDFYSPPDVQPFFSRRIGLDSRGIPQTIDGGLKLTGQAGRQDIGALYVRTGASDDVAGEDFAALRFRRHFFTQSYVGGIYTLRRGRGDGLGSFQTAGLDFRITTSTFLGSKNADIGGMILATPNSETEGDDLAYGFRVSYPNDLWNGAFHFTEVQPNHDPGVGFLRRRSFRSYHPSLSWSPRPDNHPIIRQFSFGGALALYTDLDNRALTREFDLTLIQIDGHAGDNVSFSATPTYERLDDDFEIYPGVVIPVGEAFDFTRYRIEIGTANRRVVALQPSYTWGSFFSGTRREMVLGVGLRPTPGVTVNLSAERNEIALPEGEFETRLFRLVADTQLNPRVYLVNNLQYDSLSDQVGWQARFRWIVRPGNDLYFVYNHNWFEEAGVDGFRTLDRRAATKINYTHRF
ncbi:MAG: hydrolase [Gemmatimonas sp.]|nr:hydrolase [Gemmatimonas sp.]